MPDYRLSPVLDCIVSLKRILDLSVDAVILDRVGEVLKFQVRLHGVLLNVSSI